MTVTPGREELLEPCPFCGKPLYVKKGKINPSARCVTEDCYGAHMSVINLDDPICVKAWNTRLAAKPADEGWRSIWVAKAPNDRLDFNRVYEREPSARIREEHERCGWKIVELKIREFATTGYPKP